MTRERAKELAPIIAAYGDGNAIQVKLDINASWDDVRKTESLGFDNTNAFYRIKPEPKRRLMTREEVLGFVAHNPHIVTRYDNGEWTNIGFPSFDDVIKSYQWATITAKGEIGEPHMFEVEDD